MLWFFQCFAGNFLENYYLLFVISDNWDIIKIFSDYVQNIIINAHKIYTVRLAVVCVCVWQTHAHMFAAAAAAATRLFINWNKICINRCQFFFIFIYLSNSCVLESCLQLDGSSSSSGNNNITAHSKAVNKMYVEHHGAVATLC